MPYLATLRDLAARFSDPARNVDCEPFLSLFISSNSENGNLWFHRGVVRWQLGRYDEAKGDFRRALVLGTGFPELTDVAARRLDQSPPAPPAPAG
jgi:hypothetical protein